RSAVPYRNGTSPSASSAEATTSWCRASVVGLAGGTTGVALDRITRLASARRSTRSPMTGGGGRQPRGRPSTTAYRYCSSIPAPAPPRRGRPGSVECPEFATHVTQALRVARYRIWRTPTGLMLDDGWGTVGALEVVYGAPGVRVMYAKGEFQQTVLPNIRGQAVVTIDWTVTPAPDG